MGHRFLEFALSQALVLVTALVEGKAVVAVAFRGGLDESGRERGELFGAQVNDALADFSAKVCDAVVSEHGRSTGGDDGKDHL